MRSMKLLASLALLFCAVSVSAQTGAVVPDTLWSGGDGKIEVAPDTALVQFSISVQESEMKKAYARAQQSAEHVRQVLREIGVDPKDAEIGTFSISPVYEWKPQRNRIGYRMSSHIVVKMHDFGKMGPLLESFSDTDKSDGLSISYILSNPDAAKASAIEDAYRKARSNAEVVARAGSRVVGAMSYATVESSNAMPMPRPMAPRAYAAKAELASPVEDFTPEKITVTAHVNVLFTLK